MVTEIVKRTYECDICKRVYSDKNRAIKCEALGIPENIPIGMIQADNKRGSFYGDIVFANARKNGGISENHLHYYNPTWWATRNTPVGDSLGKDICGGVSWVPRYACFINHKLSTFDRLVAFLKEEIGYENITVLVGDTIKDKVTLDEFMKLAEEGKTPYQLWLKKKGEIK